MKKWKGFGLVIFVICLVFASLQVVSAKDNENHIQHDEKVNARVATYNIQAGMGMDGEYDLDRIADTIRGMNADVVGLQEVDVHWGDRSHDENTVKRLADKLEMEYYFAPIYDRDPSQDSEDRRQYGVAILSEYPIKQATNQKITRLSTQESDSEPELAPGFLEAEIDVDGADAWFYVTHLDYRNDPAIREDQVSDMFQVMREHHYPVLMGDMNATPDAPELQPLFDWFDDAWEDSKKIGNGYTFPADSPTKRIDYLLTSKRMNVANAEVDPSAASDHFPVVADITMVPGKHSLTTEGTRMLVDAFQKEGEITSDDSSHALTVHLRAISHYEKYNKGTKVVKHLHAFQALLQEQREKGVMSEQAYSELQGDAEYLISKWKNAS